MGDKKKTLRRHERRKKVRETRNWK
jgi:hypothetical protein